MPKKNEEEVIEEQNTEETQDGFSTFQEWMDSLSDELKETGKKLYDSDVAGLKTTVTTLRDEGKTLTKQLRDLGAKAEKGSELEGQLQTVADKLELSEKKLAFYEGSIAAKCANPKLAFVLAMNENLFKADGSPDWEAIKSAAPELFIKNVLDTDPSGDNHTKVKKTKTMNDWIREQAGIHLEE